MKVTVFSDDGNKLFQVTVGSTRSCDGNTCYPTEVKDALELAYNHGELPKWSDASDEDFKARRQQDRLTRTS